MNPPAKTCCFPCGCMLNYSCKFYNMMLRSKGILTPTDAYELLRCEAAPAILQTFEIR